MKAAVLLLLVLSACSRAAPPMAKQYGGPWLWPSSNERTSISLIHHQVKGCGEYYQMASLTRPEDYLVFCRDPTDHQWHAYKVLNQEDEVIPLSSAEVAGIQPPPFPDPFGSSS